MLRIPWTERKTNEEVLKEADHNRQVIKKFKKMAGQIHQTSNAKGEVGKHHNNLQFNGKKSGGRQREKIMDRLTTWMGAQRTTDTIKATQDRVKWRSMIAHASRQGTT